MANTKIPSELVAINAISGTLIADNAITSVHIAENNITATQIAINAVTALQMADGTITSAKIADGTIVTADIADGQITTGKIADSSVTTGKIAAGTILSADIANNAILTQHIDDNQITADQIADNAVGLGQLASLSRGNLIYGDSAGNPAYLAAGTSGHVLTSDGTDISWTADTDLFLASTGGTVSGDTSINRGNQTSGELLLGGTTDGGFVDFDGTNLQLNTQRDPNTGTFVNTGKSNARIEVSGPSGGSHIAFRTIDSNNTSASERMRIDKDGNVGIGTTAPASLLHLKSTTNSVGPTLIFENTNNAQSMNIDYYNNAGAVQSRIGYDEGPAAFSFKPNVSATAMYIAYDGKVGIGTTSPSGNITISNGLASAPTSITAANSYIQIGSNDYGSGALGKFMIGFGYTDVLVNTNSPAYIGFEETSTSGDTKGNLTFYTRDVITDTAPTERMRIDSAGTIFQGTTSPTLHSAVRGIVFENGSIINDVTRGAGKSMTLAQNAAVDSGNTWAYLATDEASYYQQFNGNHYFGTAPSGSAGADVTFNTKMFIANSGNLGINEISPDYKLHISGSGSAAQMQIESTSNSNAQLIFRNTTSAGSGSTGGFHIGLLGDTSGDGLIYHHHDKPIRFYTNAANTMTLTGENGMLHLNGRSGAHGYLVPQDQSLGYTNNLNAGAFGILHRDSYDSYLTGNTYYYKTGGSNSWRAKYGAYKSTVIGMVNGAINFDCSTTAPGSNGAATVGLANIVQINSDGISMAAGKGISFSANSNASGMTSELLDDYEEGTWTPANNGTQFSTQKGSYTKIGDRVFCQFEVIAGSGSSTGDWYGLPFTIRNSSDLGRGGGVVAYHNENNSESWHVSTENVNSTTFSIRMGSTQKQLTSGKRAWGFFSYLV